MNVEASTPAQSINQISSPEQLVAAREARGWSISDVAAKLGMMPRQIESIEQGRWEALPGHAFVRGAIRAYGKALQLDVAPLLSTLGPKSSAPELRPSSSLDSPLPRHGALGFDNGGSGSRIVWILLGVIGVIAIAMYFGRGADFGRATDAANGVAGPGRALEVVPIAPGSSSDASTTTGPATSAGPEASAGAGASAGAAAGVGSTAPIPAGPAASTLPSTGAAAPVPPGASGPADASASTPAAGATPGSPGTGSAAAGAATTQASSATTQASSATTQASSATTQASSTTMPASPTTPPAPATSPSAAAGSASATVPAGDVAASTAGTGATGGPDASSRAADALVLRFERESWVDIRDATGKVLLMGTQPANSTREVSGQKPYSMTIGNASFVRVEHDGRNVDLGAVTQKGVARVRVE